MKEREQESEQIRREVAERRSRRERLNGELRVRCVKYAVARTAEGASKKTIARELTVSETSVQRWLKPKPKAGGLVPVRVKPSPEAKMLTANVVVTTPHGLRVEGLSLDALCTILTKLG